MLFPIPNTERIEEYIANLRGVCEAGQGKEFMEFHKEAMRRVVDESNRLGRFLTKEEVNEICGDVLEHRK